MKSPSLKRRSVSGRVRLERDSVRPYGASSYGESEAPGEAKSEAVLADPGLADVIAAWPTLSADANRRILAILESNRL